MDIGSIQRKTTIQQPPLANQNSVPIPRGIMEYYSYITLYFDVIYVAGNMFVVSFSKLICHIMSKSINNRETKTLVRALLRIAQLYYKQGFSIKVGYIDNWFICVKEAMTS